MTTNSVNKVKLWRAKSELTVGEITKYRIYFDPRQLRNSTAWPHNLVLKVTNTTPFIYRGAILAGPYNISATCAETSGCFNIPKQPAELIVPHTKAGIKCGETWKISLSIPKEREDWTGDWTIEILSDIVFTCNRVQFEVSLFSVIDDEADEINIKNTYEDDFTLIEIFSPTITYEYFKPKDIFYLPDLTTINNVNREIEGTQDKKKSVHLVVLTHGIHGSMLDELYLREVIEEKCKHKLEHKVIVYMSDVNHSVTEDGIEKCGKRLAESILEYVGWPWTSSNSTSSTSKDVAKGPLISKISFIGHSLGGLINIFLIGYLNSVTNGIFFKDVEPVHYIAIASPLLGSTDLAWYIKIGMEWGAIGQTGKDLTLVPRSKAEQHSASGVLKEHDPPTVDSFNEEPLLLSLSRPNSSSHIALKLFKNRTLYANTSNDATVSLRTSSLFFINHDGENFIKDHNATIFDHLKHLLTAINPPETTKEYLTRSFPDKSPILHDKLYTPDDIPPITNTIASDENEEDLNNLPIEEQMARLWHKDMTWRKILVSLEGEAHTHVIVRRKWINAAGWQVIDHLLNNHEF